MIGISVSPREKRTLALGALTIGSLVLLGPVRRGERGWSMRARTSCESARAQLERSLAALSGAKSVRDSLTARRLRFEHVSTSFLTADTRSGAGPALAGLVSRLSATASLTINGMDVEVDSAPSRAIAIATVRLSGTGDVSEVSSFVSHLEANPARLSIRAFTLTQPEPSAAKTRAEALRLDLTVSALVVTWQPGARR